MNTHKTNMPLKQGLYILFTLLCHISFAQNETIEISGKVSDRREWIKRVYCLKARLYFSDSLFVDTECDTNGFYCFNVSKNIIKYGKPELWIYQDFKLIKTRFPNPPDCPYLYVGPERYMGPRPKSIDYKPDIGIYTVNLELSEACFLPRMPCFTFEKNSTRLLKCEDFDPDTSVFCYRYFLNKNPTITIEVGATSFEEKDQLKLSVDRANSIKKRLLSFGIDSARIEINGYGDSRPLTKSKDINKAKTKQERELLKSRNRSAYIVIKSWDYGTNQKEKAKLRSDETEE